MLTYNTHLKKLVLPEYGRNIQKMVDHCLTLEDREMRNACAYAIIDTMSTIFPPEGDPEEHHRKLWDHLAIMSNFSLDIDWPFEPIRPDSLETRPDPVPLPIPDVAYRQYGNVLVATIEQAAQMPDGPERDSMVFLLANHAKKLLTDLNPDGVDDERVFNDLRHISHGAIDLDPAVVKLYDYKVLPAPNGKKKKKK